MGMAEQLLMAAAGGMAKEGLVPFATTYAVFGTRRAYDFIHQVIAEENLNVKICCALPGLTTGYGPSHQATEDIAMMRGIPGLTIVDPCDALDIEQAVPQIAAHKGPVYMRLLRGKVPLVLDEIEGYRFELGKAKLLRDGADVLVISSGLMTMRALEVAQDLRGRQGRRRGAALPDDQAAGRGGDRRSRALQAPPGGGGREPLGDRRPGRSGGEHAAAPSRAARRLPAGRACRMRSSTPARCRRCTTATASAASALGVAHQGLARLKRSTKARHVRTLPDAAGQRHPLSRHRRHRARRRRPPGRAARHGRDRHRAVHAAPEVRCRRPDLARPRPRRAVERPRLDAAVRAAVPERLRAHRHRAGRAPSATSARAARAIRSSTPPPASR